MIFLYLSLIFSTTALSGGCYIPPERQPYFTPECEQYCKIGMLTLLRRFCSKCEFSEFSDTDCQLFRDLVGSTLPKEKQKKMKEFSELTLFQVALLEGNQQLKQELVAHMTFSDEDKELVEQINQGMATKHFGYAFSYFKQSLSKELIDCDCLKNYKSNEIQKQIKAGSISKEDAMCWFRLLILSRMLFSYNHHGDMLE